MKNLNQVNLIGNVGQGAEIRNLDGGKVVASFSVATNETWKDKTGEKQEHTEWHTIVAWGKLAEIVEKFVKKGSLVHISGKLKHETYEKEGAKKYITKIVARDIIILDSRQPQEAQTAPTEENDDLPF